jgi:hypothetical protein
LGFFFDRKLLFREHVRFYSTKAFTTVKAFNMLGNSSRGITALQKRLLYRTCVVPILTYGLRLWHFKGAKFQGVLKTLAKTQRVAALWITGCFRTSPTGGVESLAGLLPMHLLLRWLAKKSCLRATTFSQSHPLRPLMGDGLRGTEPAHRLGLSRSGLLSTTLLHSPLVDAAVAAEGVSRDEFEPFGFESRPAILPTTAKGGQWLPAVGETISLTARFCRGATGHAPIGEFRSRFNLPGTTHCQCMFHPTGVRELQTRDHLLRVCPLVDRPKPRQGPDTLGAWVSLLKKNSSLFAFPPVDLWDPG